MPVRSKFDVIIIGGSYAGLSAAMGLGRSLRKVLIIDGGKPCNVQTPHAHNLVTHDGETPAAIALKAKEQVMAYTTIQFIEGMVSHASGANGNFTVTTADGETYTAAKLLLATGVKDIPLPIKGFAECWGISVLHCPYCHGYEVRNQPLGVIANGEIAGHFAMLISNWTKDLVLFTNGPSTLTAEQAAKLAAHNIRIIEQPIAAVEHTDGKMQALVFEDGTKHALQAVFAKGEIAHHTDIATQLGCEMQAEGFNKGLIKTDEFGKTTVPGVYAAGDNSNPFRSLAMTIGAGNKAGPMLNMEMISEAFS